jgi:hypothetical protein
LGKLEVESLPSSPISADPAVKIEMNSAAIQLNFAYRINPARNKTDGEGSKSWG